MNNILFVAPTNGNGGIKSWADKYRKTFPNEEFNLISTTSHSRRSVNPVTNIFKRSIDGLIDMFVEGREIIGLIKSNEISIMHMTTSGGFGTFRDYIYSRICHHYDIPCIMHCRYGCISEDFKSRGFWGYLLRKTMHSFNNVWVLDCRSENSLNEDPKMKGKVYLTPNSIEVPDTCDLSPKKYLNIAFVGNLAKTKGILELVHAVCDYDLDVVLTIAGPDIENSINEIKSIAGNHFGKKVLYKGKLPNQEAVKLIKSMDCIALPTYYRSEGFPISIIEAMSYGKFVISTRRAAISDMLIAEDGTECGYFVKEKSVEDIVKAITWCQQNKYEADVKCKKAYEKVRDYYSTDVIYELYRSLYRKLL